LATAYGTADDPGHCHLGHPSTPATDHQAADHGH